MKIISLLIACIFLFTSLGYPEEFRKSCSLRVESFFKGQRPGQALDAIYDLAKTNPGPDIIKNSPEAFEYNNPSQAFKGIDIGHFIHCQNLLADKRIPVEEYEKLVNAGYTKDIVDGINKDTYHDPRFEVKVIDQSKNPRMQAILEAVSNSLDSLGLDIGQFGLGVKQIVSWLEATGIDRIDVWTSQGDKAYQLTILEDSAGQNYIQIKPVSRDEFKEYSINGAHNGTIVKVTVKRKISQPEDIIGLIRSRFPFIKTVDITTQIGDAPIEKVNGFKIIKVIVSGQGINYEDRDKAGKFVHIAIRDTSITISDNGRGMDAEKVSKMFVPNQGDKITKPLSREDIEKEKKGIEVIHISAPEKKVLFSRNGEVIFSAKIPQYIAKTAGIEGGLILELGKLMPVQQSRAKIPVPFNLQAKSGFQAGMEYAISGIINNSGLTPAEKANYINTIIIGLDAITESNDNYSYIIRLIRIYAHSSMQEIVNKLRQEGYAILPHDRQFEQIAIPDGKKAFFLHEKLFDWQGAISLKELGGEVLPGFDRTVVIDGIEFSQSVVIAPFKREIIEPLSSFNPLFNNLEEEKLAPMIKTEQFIAIPSTPKTKRLLILARKRGTGDLGGKEEQEFMHLLECVNILTAQEEVTRAEFTAARKNITLLPAPALSKFGSGIDSDSINSFLAKPPFVLQPGSGKVPIDANQRYVLTEEGIMEIGTGHIVFPESSIVKMEYVAYGYYDVTVGTAAEAENKIKSKRFLVFVSRGGIQAVSEKDGIFPGNSKIVFSPDKRFAFDPDNCEKILDLKQGRLLPLTRALSTKITNPQFSPDFKDLIIDNSDSTNPVATDKESGIKFHYHGEIIQYDKDAHILYCRNNGKYDAIGCDSVNSIAEYIFLGRTGATNNPPHNFMFVLFPLTGSKSEWHFYKKPDTWWAKPWCPITQIGQRYNQVSFDGKYFVFSDPKTGDVIYFDPERFEGEDEAENAMTFVPASSEENQAFKTSKPSDAPNRFIVAGSAIIDTKNDKVIEAGFNRALRIDGNNFVLYNTDGAFNLKKFDEDGRPKVRGQYTKEAELVCYNNRMVVVDDGLWIKIHILAKNIIHLRPKSDNKKIELSVSGRFVVYKKKGPYLYYYDVDNNKDKAIMGDYSDYRVHDRADVVILEDQQGKYSLFSLTLGRMLVAGANRIDIDSTGVIAVVSVDAKSWGDNIYLRIINLKTGEYPDIKGNIIRIKADEQDVAVKIYDIFMLIYACDRKTGERKFETGIYRRLEKQNAEQYYAIPSRKIIGKHELLFSGHSPMDKDVDMYMEEGILVIKRPSGPTIGKFIYKLIDIETDKKIDAWRHTGNLKIIKFFKGGKVFYGVNKKGEIIWFYTLKDYCCHYIEFLINKSNTFILGRQGPFLFDIEGNKIDISGLIEPGFIPIEANGDYFIFYNPKTKEIRYLDPNIACAMNKAQKKPEDNEKQARINEYWNKEVLAQRDELIEKIRPSYQLFIESIPEEYKNNTLKAIKPFIDRLFKNQEEEIRKRFSAGFQDQRPLDLWTGSIFDIFSARASELKIRLDKFLASGIANQLLQEEPHIQSRFYSNLFSGLFQIAMNQEIRMDKLSSRYLNLLGLGWKVDKNIHVKAMPIIERLVKSLKHAGMAEEMKIVTFMSRISADKDEKKHGVLIKKLARLLGNKSMFAKFKQSLERTELKKLLDYLDNPQAKHELGDAMPFVIYLTNDAADFIKEKKERIVFDGEDIAMPPGGIEISQIIKLETQRPKKGASDLVMSMDYLIRHINALPARSIELESGILHNVSELAESGAYAREISQNTKDLVLMGYVKNAELEIECYLQTNESGQKEYVEEARDNGTGALYPGALLIPKSLKAIGRQIKLGGFFATGKDAFFEDLDRLEIITKSKDEAWLFNYDVIRTDSGVPVAIKLTRIQRIDDSRLKQGLTVRRIKLAKNTIPELDQMLSQRAWKIFAGLSQDEHFKIFFIDYKGARKQLFVEKEELSRVNFSAESSLSIIETKDMPLQVLDKDGRRVKELKDEYLSLIPQALRKHVKELGINIRIPLPLIHSRDEFENEDEYLRQGIIQRYVAMAFYKALAYKTMKQPEPGRPQFVFEGFPTDWEFNELYWGSFMSDIEELINKGITRDFWRYFTPKLDERLARLVTHINEGEYEKVEGDDLEALLSPDNKKLFIQLIMLLNAPDMSLLDRRVGIQIRAMQERNGMPEHMLFNVAGIPFAKEKIDEISASNALYKQREHIDDFKIDPGRYTDEEKEFIQIALAVTGRAGFNNIVLMDEKLARPGFFMGDTIYLRRDIAKEFGKSNLSQEIIDIGTYIVIHELAHYLEQVARLNENGTGKKDEIYIIPEDFYTHTARGGIFDKAMRYIAWLSLADNELEARQPAPSAINFTHGAMRYL